VALPEHIRRILPPDTVPTLGTLAPVSRDLDFFYHHAALDLDQVADKLAAADPFTVTLRAPGTLNGRFSGLRIAALEDLIAMKLKVVGAAANCATTST
jgi:hypothetical protein